MTEKRRRTIRVLVVDTDVVTRTGVTKILSSEPAIEVVGGTGDGLAACDLAQRLAPDVVVTEVQLSTLSGIEVTRQVTADERTSAKVLVLTTFDVDEFRAESMEAGASGYFLKRSTAEEIVAAVRRAAAGEVLQHQRPASQGPRSQAHRPVRFTPPLTARELNVLACAARGLSNQEIADRLVISVETVRSHLKAVYAKFGARSRLEAVLMAFESGLVGAPGNPGTAGDGGRGP